MCGDITRGFLFTQASDRIAGAPELEGSCPLEIFTFTIEFASEGFVKKWVIEYGCEPHLLPDSGMGTMYICNIRQICCGDWFHFRRLIQVVALIIMPPTKEIP
jgi:hypothetical protein